MCGGPFEQKKAGKKGKKKGVVGGGGVKRFSPHIEFKSIPAVTSKIWSKLILATLCVMLRSRVLIIYVGARRGLLYARCWV